jgi:hypothetical protein
MRFTSPTLSAGGAARRNRGPRHADVQRGTRLMEAPGRCCGPRAVRVDLFIGCPPAVVPAGVVIDVGPQVLAGSRGVCATTSMSNVPGEKSTPSLLPPFLSNARGARCPDRLQLVLPDDWLLSQAAS